MVPLLRGLNLFQFFCHLLHLFLQPLRRVRKAIDLEKLCSLMRS
jgi:hypothetical protein